MGIKIKLRWSNDSPADPLLRRIESLARADRQSLGYRFGEPCDPRRLTQIYDVSQILETVENYESYPGISLLGNWSDLDSLSGLLVPMDDGNYLVLVNPNEDIERRNFTIAHEFGHLALQHKHLEIPLHNNLTLLRYDDQEQEAFRYALAVLMPFAPLLQMLQQGATVRGIAHHYCVSIPAVHFRLKTAGLWGLRR